MSLILSLFREVNQPIPNTILFDDPVESVAITRLPSFPAPDTADQNT